MNNIVLCGFMGCGKSSVGQILAQITDRLFVDTDELIEKNENMTISQIFDKIGENGFRDAEHIACKAAANMRNAVISTGGGALTFERNVSVFNNDKIIFLDVPFDEISRRISDDGARPLFKDKSKAKELFDVRIPLYRTAAHYVIDGMGDKNEIANRILTILKEG